MVQDKQKDGLTVRYMKEEGIMFRDPRIHLTPDPEKQYVSGIKGKAKTCKACDCKFNIDIAAALIGSIIY